RLNVRREPIRWKSHRRSCRIREAGGDDGRHKRKASADRGPKSERSRLLGTFVNLVEQSRIQLPARPLSASRHVVTCLDATRYLMSEACAWNSVFETTPLLLTSIFFQAACTFGSAAASEAESLPS